LTFGGGSVGEYKVLITGKTEEALQRLQEHYEYLEVSQIVQKAILLLDRAIQMIKNKEKK